MLFSLLGIGGEVSIQIWKLLTSLPTSPKIMEQVIKLEGIRNSEKPDWSQIFDANSNYKLLYILTIIEFLMEDDEEEENKKQNTAENSSNQLQE